ncbi:hypothetical protein CBL_14155 [Carabus blaptoides fortunei]
MNIRISKGWLRLRTLLDYPRLAESRGLAVRGFWTKHLEAAVYTYISETYNVSVIPQNSGIECVWYIRVTGWRLCCVYVAELHKI